MGKMESIEAINEIKEYFDFDVDLSTVLLVLSDSLNHNVDPLIMMEVNDFLEVTAMYWGYDLECDYHKAIKYTRTGIEIGEHISVNKALKYYKEFKKVWDLSGGDIVLKDIYL